MMRYRDKKEKPGTYHRSDAAKQSKAKGKERAKEWVRVRDGMGRGREG